jgi:N utilization substance protein B
MNRRQARELAMRALFARDVAQGRPRDVLGYLVEEEHVAAATAERAGALVDGVLADLAGIDRLIAAYARDWSLPRLAAVDRNVLRVAFFELLHSPDVPAGAAIDEALEVAKAFGGEDSSRFVNGVLGQFVRDRTAGTVAPH